MKRPLLFASLAGLALAAPLAASAHVEVSVGLGFPGYYVPPPVVYVPPPRYYYAPPPAVIYEQPQVIYRSDPYWGDDWRDDDDDRGGWHRGEGWQGDHARWRRHDDDR